jgi:hypothetical protein
MMMMTMKGKNLKKETYTRGGKTVSTNVDDAISHTVTHANTRYPTSLPPSITMMISHRRSRQLKYITRQLRRRRLFFMT